MTDTFKFAALPGFAVVALALALGACSQGGFVEEGSDKPPADDNLAKNLLIGMGAIDDPNQKQLKFPPRAPLVVPPKRTLPTPVDSDAAAANSRFPVNPEDAERKVGAGDGAGERALSPAEQAKYGDLPVAPRPGDGRTYERDASKPLSPQEMAGQGQASKDAIAAAEAQRNASRSVSLLTPPSDYRTPSPKAPTDPEPEKKSSSWWPF